MSPELTRHWKDELARLRYERGAFAKRAAQRRKDAADLKRQRDFLGALQATSRANEYRNSRDQLDGEIRRVRRILAGEIGA